MLKVRLHSLDALRGIAALAVVVWHWQHFFYISHDLPDSFVQEKQPFFAIFKIFYSHGASAVDLFFSLSGFIFFWLYAHSIAERKIRPATFFLLRFSRLYPLHLITLLAVCGGQLAYLGMHDATFVYPNFDIKHLFLNILLLTSVGLESSLSFNGPTWSVSVEVAMYLIFFIVCRLKWNRPATLVFLAIAGALINIYGYQPLGRGCLSFFLGGLVFFTYRSLAKSSREAQSIKVIGLIAGVLWIASILFAYQDWSLAEMPVIWRLSGYFSVLFTFPATILLVALIDKNREHSTQQLSALGNISYSAYLLHFPLQLLMVSVVDSIGISRDFFYSHFSFILYFVILIPLALATFHFFEKPVQRRLRAHWHLG